MDPAFREKGSQIGSEISLWLVIPEGGCFRVELGNSPIFTGTTLLEGDF